MDRSSGSRSGAPDSRPEGGREVRWSARRKQEVVLRLLRGESLDALARETGQAAGVIAGWREEFLAAGHEGLNTRPVAVEDRRLADAQRKIGELTMDLDIAKALIEEVDRRPGSVGVMPDDELLAAIRREIDESPFVGEGHKKLRARLALRGIHTSGKRVLRLTREAGLLAPTPQVVQARQAPARRHHHRGRARHAVGD